MKKPRMNERNQLFREEYRKRMRNGESSASVIQSLSERFFLSFDTVKQIVYKTNYGEYYQRELAEDIRRNKLAVG
jgi:hypothetical protein